MKNDITLKDIVALLAAVHDVLEYHKRSCYWPDPHTKLASAFAKLSKKEAK